MRGMRLLNNNDANRIKDIQKEIKFLTNSDNRLEILYCLYKFPHTLKEIHEKTGLNNSSISINISDLENKNYVINKNDVYYLTNSSKMILTNIFYLNKSINFFDCNADFLNSHKISKLGINALKDMSYIGDSQLVEANHLDIYKVIRLFKDFSLGSKSIKTIFPFMHPQINDLLNDWFSNDVDVKLILEKRVSDVFIDAVRNFKFEKDSKSEISVKIFEEALDFALVVTDKGIILGFNKEDGKFDQNAVYISEDEDAIVWGRNLFEEYEKLCSEYISLNELMEES